MQLEIKTPDAQELMAQAESVIVAPLVIRDGNDYVTAADKLKIIKGFSKGWEDMRTKLKAPILEAGRQIDALFKPAQERLASTEKTIKTAMLDYDREQEKIRAAEQARLQEIARKEQERLAALAAETERKAKEKADALRKEAEAAAAAGRAEEAAKLAAKAQSTEDKAESRAQQLNLSAAHVITPIVPATQIKIAGQSKIETWKHRVVDASLVPREYMIVNDSALANVARATKGAIQIPGVEFYHEQSIRSGTR